MSHSEPPGLSDERRRAYQMRDFISPEAAADTTLDSNVHLTDVPSSSGLDIDKLPFIDEPHTEEETDAEEEINYRGTGDTGEILNNAACRLRRWRAASRKLRRPRIINNLCVSEKSHSTGPRTDLTERLRSLAAVTSGNGGICADPDHLLALAPPAAATAPPSPSCLPLPSLADQSAVDYFGSSPECCGEATPMPPPGPRYKLATEGIMQVCSFQHTRTVIDKILSSKFLRRWETHVLCLLEDHISSKTPCGLLEKSLPYHTIQEVYPIQRWDLAHKYCLRIVMPNGSLLLQANNAYARDQWYHSIVWKRSMMKFRKILTKRSKNEVILKELKNMVDLVMTTPLHDETVANAPLQIVSDLLNDENGSEDEDSGTFIDKTLEAEFHGAMVVAIAPLLADRGPGSGALCAALSRLCRQRPRVAPLPALAPAVRRVLTRNVDFARAPHARRLVRDYISALSVQNSGNELVRRFVEVTHGPAEHCPHPRAAPNLAAVALAALNDTYRPTTNHNNNNNSHQHPHVCSEDEDEVLCFADILLHMCEYVDWLVVVAGVLQPVPVAAEALACPRVASRIEGVVRAIASDGRCAVHGALTAARAARRHPPSWLRATAPFEPLLALSQPQLCLLWGDMLGSLLNCCCRRKGFLQELSIQLPDFLLVALTEHEAALEALCLMLEWDVPNGEQTRLEIIATLQGTELGQQHYKELCQRQEDLLQLQAVGGPRRLALPVKATDADVARLLTAGSFGNLECLSLAFTSVTSACAYELIKLPTLRYLNLWATQFGDAGVQLIAEHLTKLQVLNLCETPISDKGIEALSALPSLRRLNLNSTKLSAEAFQDLKQRLPHLQEYDIRYTEAW